MKKREARAVVKATIKRWKPLLGLGAWEIVVHFIGEDAVPPRYRGEEGHDYMPLMWIEPEWEYMHACITVVVPRITGYDAESIAAFVRHELLHAVVNEMRVDDVRHEERVVSTLEHAFGVVYARGHRDGRKAAHRESTTEAAAAHA